jgi:hypothetical protein
MNMTRSSALLNASQVSQMKRRASNSVCYDYKTNMNKLWSRWFTYLVGAHNRQKIKTACDHHSRRMHSSSQTQTDNPFPISIVFVGRRYAVRTNGSASKRLYQVARDIVADGQSRLGTKHSAGRLKDDTARLWNSMQERCM